MKLREEQGKVWMEIERLREDFNRAFKHLDARLSRVERTLEKLTLDIEDEARIIVEHRLKEMGYEVKIDSLTLPEVEVNIYGVSGDLCIIGGASVRASSKAIDDVDKSIKVLKALHPELLRPKIVRVIYTSLAMPDLVKRAQEEGVWVLKAIGDIVKPKL